MYHVLIVCIPAPNVSADNAAAMTLAISECPIQSLKILVICQYLICELIGRKWIGHQQQKTAQISAARCSDKWES